MTACEKSQESTFIGAPSKIINGKFEIYRRLFYFHVFACDKCQESKLPIKGTSVVETSMNGSEHQEKN